MRRWDHKHQVYTCAVKHRVLCVSSSLTFAQQSIVVHALKLQLFDCLVPGTVCRHHSLVGACVRMYKFLMSDYIEEFSANLRTWLVENMRLLRPGERDGLVEDARHAKALQQLYGQEVPGGNIAILLSICCVLL